MRWTNAPAAGAEPAPAEAGSALWPPMAELGGESAGDSSRRAGVLLAWSLAVLLAVAAYGIFKDRAVALEQERESARNLANSAQMYATEMLNQTLYSLQGIQHDLAGADRRPQGARLHALREATRFDPTSMVLGVQGADGVEMVDSAGDRIDSPELEVAVFRALAVPSDERLAVLPAIYAAQFHDWLLPVKLRSVGPDGQAESIFALVAARRLVAASSSVRLLPESFIVFATPDGERLFRYIEDRDAIEVNSQPLAPVTREQVRKGGNGNFETTAQVNGVWTLFGYSASSKLPIVALIAVPARALDEAWIRRSAGQMLLLAMAGAAVVYFGLRLKSTCGALSKSKTLFRELFDSVDEGLLVLDRGGVVRTCNPGAARILGGESPRALVGRNLMSLSARDPGVEAGVGLGQNVLESLGTGQSVSTRGSFARLDSGHVVDVEMRLSAFPEGSRPLVTARLRDVGKEHRYLKQQEYLAAHDSLTGLLNRNAFQLGAQSRIDAAGEVPFGVVLMDLNRLKEINDTLGHQAGDAVLVELGQRLRSLFGRGRGLVARLGGDEIAVCAPLADFIEGLDGLCRGLQDLVRQPVVIDGVPLEMTASLGAAVYPEDAKTPRDLLRCADIAMYAARRELRSHQRYRPTLDHFTRDSLALQAEFACALREGGLSLVYQPKVSMATGNLVGVEALSRWMHPVKGPVPPATFIPLAETTELIHPFTEFVLREALAQARRWLSAGHTVPVSVNISANNLMDSHFVEMIRGLLALYVVPASQLELEVTESALMRNPDSALRRLEELRALGVGLAIDDFGTGYASLTYLKKLPIDVLKIDKSFTAALATDDGDKRIVRSTIQLAHEFGKKVVAEGVETAEVAAMLRQMGCDIAQGYLFAKPLSADLLTQRWLAPPQDSGRQMLRR